jgi:molybdopterin converting factor small subunit
VRVRVLAFARIAEIVGSAASEREVRDGATVGDLWDDLGREFPALPAFRASTRFARNGAFVAATQALVDGDELALLPPFGGG